MNMNRYKKAKKGGCVLISKYRHLDFIFTGFRSKK